MDYKMDMGMESGIFQVDLFTRETFTSWSVIKVHTLGIHHRQACSVNAACLRVGPFLQDGINLSSRHDDFKPS